MTPTELKSLIAQREGSKVDFKRNLRDDSFRDLSKDLAAFSNAEGGYILIGVDNNGDILGVDWSQEKSARVQQEGAKCTPKIQPTISNVTIHKEGTIVVIEIPKSASIHQDDHQRFPMRVGDTTVSMDSALFLAVAKSKGMISDSSSFEGSLNFLTPQPRKRMRKPSKISFLADFLSDGKATKRSEALKDLSSVAFNFSIEEIAGLEDKLLVLVTDQDRKVRMNSLHTIYSIFSRSGKSKQKRLRQKMIPIIEKAAVEDPDTSVRNRAIQLACQVDSPNAIPLILQLMRTEPEKTYSNLGVTNGFQSLVAAGRGYELKRALYTELSGEHSSEVENRVLAAMDFLRDLPWAH